MILILLVPINISGDNDVNATLGASYRFEYNRTLGAGSELFFQSDFNVTDFWGIGAGFSTAFHSFPERMYISTSIKEFPPFLNYNITFLTRDFSEYGIKETSLFPTVALLTRFFEFEMGSSFRWTHFEDNEFSTHILYRLQVNIIAFPAWELIYKMANFDLFRAENVSTLYHTIGNKIRVDNNWIIVADLGIHNAGQIAFSSFLTALYAEIGFRYEL